MIYDCDIFLVILKVHLNLPFLHNKEHAHSTKLNHQVHIPMNGKRASLLNSSTARWPFFLDFQTFLQIVCNRHTKIMRVSGESIYKLHHTFAYKVLISMQS